MNTKTAEICNCDNEDCTNTFHAADEPTTYNFWYKGEYWNTVGSENTPARVISEITALAETPNEYADWLVKNKFTKQRWTFPEFRAQHATVEA